MSSRKEERKDETTITSSSTSTASPAEHNAQYRQTVNRALDETKDNIRRSTDEARREIPRYTQAVNEYQEQTIQASREIADNYIDSQKQIINSLQSAWVPFAENTYGVFWNYWVSPRRTTELYARAVSSVADNTIAVTRLVNNAVFANMEAFRTSVQNLRDNAKEFSRINVNTVKTFEQTSRDTAAEGHAPRGFYVETEEREQKRRF
jgi:hypothetical protein